MSHPSARVLCLIDDNADDLLFTRLLLHKGGVPSAVVTFTSSHHALYYLRQVAAGPGGGAPHAFILDGNMPELDGFALIRELRNIPAFRAARIVMLSGSEQPRDRQRATEAGANAYLLKFPSATTLVDALAA